MVDLGPGLAKFIACLACFIRSGLEIRQCQKINHKRGELHCIRRFLDIIWVTNKPRSIPYLAVLSVLRFRWSPEWSPSHTEVMAAVYFVTWKQEFKSRSTVAIISKSNY